jgi:hypothetical protein
VIAAPSLPALLLADTAGSLTTAPATMGLLGSGRLAGQPAPAAAKLASGSKQPNAGFSGNTATAVVVLAGLPPAGSRPAKARTQAPSGSSSSFGADGAMISREVGYPSEAEFRQDFAVNLTKEKTKQAAMTSKYGQLPAEVVLDGSVDNVNNKKSTEDGTVDKLDADALKATLEKPFNR